MTLHEAVDSYVALKRSLGAVFSADTRILHSFVRALGDIPLDTVDAEATHAFCRGTGPPTRWWERKHNALRGFFTYLVARGHLSVSPLVEPGPRIVHSFEPYIYSRDELQRLLDATVILEDSCSPLQHATFRTLLLVLYGAGLRPSEGLRLRCCDVEISTSASSPSGTRSSSSLGSCPSAPHSPRRSVRTTRRASVYRCRPGLGRPSSLRTQATRSSSAGLRRCLSDSVSMLESKDHRALVGNRGVMTCAIILRAGLSRIVAGMPCSYRVEPWFWSTSDAG